MNCGIIAEISRFVKWYGRNFWDLRKDGNCTATRAKGAPQTRCSFAWRRRRDLKCFAPLLRCPKCAALALARRISTASPTPARCFSHRERSQALPAPSALGFNLVSTMNKATAKAVALFLSMGYKKDIFGSFAYEFELLRFLVKSLTCSHGEIICFVNCAIIFSLHLVAVATSFQFCLIVVLFLPLRSRSF